LNFLNLELDETNSSLKETLTNKVQEYLKRATTIKKEVIDKKNNEIPVPAGPSPENSPKEKK
jgi:hypothetical protein